MKPNNEDEVHRPLFRTAFSVLGAGLTSVNGHGLSAHSPHVRRHPCVITPKGALVQLSLEVTAVDNATTEC